MSIQPKQKQKQKRSNRSTKTDQPIKIDSYIFCAETQQQRIRSSDWSKKIIKESNTQQISHEPLTMSLQPKQKQKRSNSNKKGVQPIKLAAAIFVHEHSNNKLGVHVVIE